MSTGPCVPKGPKAPKELFSSLMSVAAMVVLGVESRDGGVVEEMEEVVTLGGRAVVVGGGRAPVLV